MVHLQERIVGPRRYQKVVEVVPSIGLPDNVVTSCDAGVQLVRKGYDNAGIEFLSIRTAMSGSSLR